MKASNEEILALCLTGKTQRQIADTLGMTKAQICRRINTPEFQSMLTEFRHKILDSVVTDLLAYAKKAVETLVKLLDDENSFCRLQAATKIISMAQDFTLQKDLLDEINKLKYQNEEV